MGGAEGGGLAGRPRKAAWAPPHAVPSPHGHRPAARPKPKRGGATLRGTRRPPREGEWASRGMLSGKPRLFPACRVIRGGVSLARRRRRARAVEGPGRPRGRRGGAEEVPPRDAIPGRGRRPAEGPRPDGRAGAPRRAGTRDARTRPRRSPAAPEVAPRGLSSAATTGRAYGRTPYGAGWTAYGGVSGPRASTP